MYSSNALRYSTTGYALECTLASLGRGARTRCSGAEREQTDENADVKTDERTRDSYERAGRG